MANWNTSEEALTELQKIIKRRKKVASFVNAEMKFGEVYDPLKESIVIIKDATTSTLNRISKSLNAMYKSSEVKDTRRDIILNKKKEIDEELLKRNQK